MAVKLSRPAALARPASPEEELDRVVELTFAAARRFWRVAEGPLRTHGLGAAHYRALNFIRRAEGQPVSSLRHRLGVRKQSLARVLAELEDAGFIERLPGLSDKRMRLIALTPAGRTAERATTAALRERAARVFAAAGPEAAAHARTVLAMLARDEPG